MSISLFCHTQESLKQLPPENQELIYSMANAIAPLVNEFPQRNVPFRAKQQLWKIFMTCGYVVPGEVFELMEEDDSLEMWRSDFRFIQAMGPVIDSSNYSLEELSTLPWSELFDREAFAKKQLVEAWLKALETNTAQVDVTDWHIAWETKTPQKQQFLIKVKLISPYQNAKTKETGIFALVKFKPLSSLE